MTSTKQETMQVAFRIEEALHATASLKAKATGGLSSVLRRSFEDFVSGRRSFAVDKFELDTSSRLLTKRVSLKIDQSLYDEVQAKATRYGGVSGLARAALKQYCQEISSSGTNKAD